MISSRVLFWLTVPQRLERKWRLLPEELEPGTGSSYWSGRLPEQEDRVGLAPGASVHRCIVRRRQRDTPRIRVHPKPLFWYPLLDLCDRKTVANFGPVGHLEGSPAARWYHLLGVKQTPERNWKREFYCSLQCPVILLLLIVLLKGEGLIRKIYILFVCCNP